ncbi:MAG: nSTAND1 domain-containing NTPase, partial [Isosphaeraceae bacterium]
LHAATVSGGRVAVVMTMRSDFLGACAPFEQLNAVLSAHQEQVGPMSAAELREAIERPAFLAGCGVEPALTERLLADVEGQPGALPLLQFALTETWKARDTLGNLTLRAYEKLGENERGEQRGIKGVLDRRANEIYRDLPAKDQELCKWLFLRLVQPGEGTEDTKRRASFGELVPAGSDAKSVESVISRLADARLITTWADPKDPGKTSVEVAHEALIRGWTQLRGWIDEDRAGLRLHLQLTAAAHEWEKQVGDAGYLYQGTRLAEAWKWAEAHPQELNFGERKFLEASVQHELYLKASQLVGAIRVAETKDVPPLVKQLADRRLWEAKKQLLDPIIMNSDGDSKEHLHASLALLPEDDEQVEYLYHCLLKASPTELPVIRDALKQYQKRLVERLWSVLEQPKDEGQYLQAASALALYDQSNPRWQNVGGKVAQAMVKVNVVYLRDWLDALHPARGELTAPLATIFRDKKHSETERFLAMNILADYASDQPTLLADLLMDSEENPFAALFDKLKTHQDLAVRPL